MQDYKQPRWADRTDRNADPANFYLSYYPGMKRGRLAKTDNALYRYLSRHERLDEVIPEFDREIAERSRRVRRRSSKYGTNPLAYYREHYPRFTRWEILQIDPGLYHKLRYERLLHRIPSKNAKKKSKKPQPR